VAPREAEVVPSVATRALVEVVAPEGILEVSLLPNQPGREVAALPEVPLLELADREDEEPHLLEPEQ